MQLGRILFKKKSRLDSCFLGKATYSLMNVDAELLTVTFF